MGVLALLRVCVSVPEVFMEKPVRKVKLASFSQLIQSQMSLAHWFLSFLPSGSTAINIYTSSHNIRNKYGKKFFSKSSFSFLQFVMVETVFSKDYKPSHFTKI